MNGGHDERGERRLHEFAAMLRHAKIPSEQRLRGGGAQANDDFRLQRSDFRVKPWPARGDFGAAGFFVNAAFAAKFLLEMLDGIGDVGFFAADAGFLQSAVQ